MTPFDKDLHFNLGYIYYNLNNISAAIREYRKVIELDPFDKEAYYNLALIYSRLNNKKKFEFYYREYLELDYADIDK